MQDMRQAYSLRASEYIDALGSVKDMNDMDVSLITNWGRGIDGPILDAGSGPGHWTGLLCDQGCEACGIDVVPEFVDSARQRFPQAKFKKGDILDIPYGDSSFGGVLAWYSLIHLPPKNRQRAFEEFFRILKPGGSILVAVFLGGQGESFDHAVTEAFYWSENGLVDDLVSVGFHDISTHTRCSEGARPHLEVIARAV